MKIEENIKNIIEENPLALATVNLEKVPHVIAVAFAKVKENKIIITDNYMKTTLENIKQNKNVSLAVWNQEWEGYEIIGRAEHFDKGDYMDFVKSLPENEEEPCKGVIVVEVDKIKSLS